MIHSLFVLFFEGEGVSDLTWGEKCKTCQARDSSALELVFMVLSTVRQLLRIQAAVIHI